MILAIDQGTSGTTCLVFDLEGELVGRGYREFTQHFPKPGWVEHDAQEIWEVTQAVAGEALADAGVRRGELSAVGITNQRKRSSSGIRPPGGRCTRRWSGRTGARPVAARGSGPPVTRT